MVVGDNGANEPSSASVTIALRAARGGTAVVNEHGEDGCQHAAAEQAPVEQEAAHQNGLPVGLPVGV